jgi:hypothetical protein
MTRAQIVQLSKRIDALTDQLGAAVRRTYTVWLSFTDEDDEAFCQRHPDARGRRDKAIVLSFADGAATRLLER